MKIMVLIALALLPLTSWASCTVYEYAEIQDMSVTELQAGADAYRDEGRKLTTLAEEHMTAGYTRDIPALLNASMTCNSESARMYKVMYRKMRAARDGKIEHQ